MNRQVTRCERYDRRGFLHVGAASLFGLGLSQLLRSRAAADETIARPAKSVIMVWLAGGPPTIDMWDMKPNAPAGVRGEFASIDASLPGVQVCEHLPKLAAVMHHCCLVRSCHHTLAAHGPGAELLLTGNKPNPATRYPSLGSLSCQQRDSTKGVPGYIALGEGADAGAGYLGAAFNPFKAEAANSAVGPPTTAVGLPDRFDVVDLDRRGKLLAQFDQQLASLEDAPIAAQLGRFQQQAIDILRSDKTRQALDVRNETEQVRQQYGSRPLGVRLLAARRLVQAGVPFVTVGMAGWDTHSDNFGRLRTQLLPELDQALAALLGDLAVRGLLDSTLVYCTGEFGRTPAINSGAGRDHWARAMSPLLAGGPLRRGLVYGSTDKLGYEPLDAPCSPMDIAATVLHCIGVAPETVLTTPSGRPLPAIANGRPLAELLA